MNLDEKIALLERARRQKVREEKEQAVGMVLKLKIN